MIEPIIKTIPSGAQDLWDALKQASPELALAVETNPPGVAHSLPINDFPGLRPWLIAEFALNVSTRLISDRLQAIGDQQRADGIVRPWPYLNHLTIDGYRRSMADEWRPVRAKIETAIEQVGVIRKQTRLMSLASLAEELHNRMFDERNQKTGQLYLQHDYLAVLKQIGEEMGDLGEGIGDTTGGLLEIAKKLAEVVSVQGKGIQEREIQPYAYDGLGE